MHVYSSLCAIQLLFRLFRKPLCAAVAFAGISLYWLGDIFCLWAVLHAFYAHTPPIAPLLVAYATGYALTRRALPLGGAGVVEAILLFALGAVAIQRAPAVLAVGGYRLTTSGCRCFQRSPGSRRSGGSSASDATAGRRTPRRNHFAAQDANRRLLDVIATFPVRYGCVLIEGWETWERQTASGAVGSEQSVVLRAPVVEFSDVGAQHLGQAYWGEVEKVTRRVVRARVRNGSLELRLLGHGPALLRFGAPQIEATDELASCSYPIRGGLLARRSTGEIVFAQVGSSSPVLRSTIRGFFPRFAARQGEPDWTGALYNKVQSRIHVAVSRRYFARLIAEGQT